jgi:hypothetical protein
VRPPVPSAVERVSPRPPEVVGAVTYQRCTSRSHTGSVIARSAAIGTLAVVIVVRTPTS